MKTTSRTLSTAAALLAALAASNAAGQVSNWDAPIDGNWNDSAGWDNLTVPLMAGQSAALGLTGMYTVTMNVDPSIDSISVTNPDALLIIPPSGDLTLLGASSTNNGTIRLNPNASSANAIIHLPSNHAFNGAGEIWMSTFSDNSQISGLGTLTNGSAHAIRGVGIIDVPAVNNGLIAADVSVSVSGSDLDIREDVVNNAFIRSETGSILDLFGTIVDQTGGGSIVAATGGIVNVTSSSASILGGTLNTEGTGEIRVNGGGTATLDSVTSLGFLVVDPSGTVDVFGSGIINDGLIMLNRNASTANSIVSFEETGMLAGTGELQMRTASDNSQLLSADGVVVTQAASHSIRGVGYVNAALVNNGLVAADVGVSVSGNILEIQTNDKVNNGIFSAQSGSVLSIEGVAVDQLGGGQLVAEDGGEVRLTSASIDGGVFNANGTGFMSSQSSVNALSGVTLNGPLSIRAATTVNVDADGLVNHNVMTANSSASTADAVLNYTASAGLSGSGELQMRTAGSNTIVSTDGAAVITHAGPHTIRGVGDINASMINNGEIRADVSVSVSGNDLNLQTNDKINNNLIAAEPNSFLDINGITIDQTSGGMMVATDGTFRLASAAIDGGQFVATGTGSMQTSGGVSSLSGLTMNGPLTINPSHTIHVDADGMTNNATIQMNPAGSTGDSVLTFTADGTLDGTGEIQMRTQADNTQINTDPTFTMTHGANHVIRGVGQINAAIDNLGTISADVAVSVSGNALELQGEAKINRGLITVEASSFMDVQTDVTQLGAGSMVANDGQFRFNTSASLIGGSIDATGTGNYIINGPTTFENVTVNAPGVIDPSDTLTVTGAGLTNNNLLVVNPIQSSGDAVIAFPFDGTLAGTGEVRLFTGGSNSLLSGPGVITNGAAHTISGLGRITTDFVNNGFIRPGNDAVGTLESSGDVTFGAGGTYVAEIQAGNQSDRFAISGNANLGGTLDITEVPGFDIANQIDYTILTAGSVIGEFDTVNLIVDGNLVTRIIYEPTQVRLLTRCKADTNLDGSVTPGDFTAWVNAFNNMDPVADQNLDGLITPGDFTAWIVNFNAGCP